MGGKDTRILLPALTLAVKTQAFSRLVVEITCWGSRRPAWALLEASWAAGHCSVAGGLGQPQRGLGGAGKDTPARLAHLSGDMCPAAPSSHLQPHPTRGMTANGEGSLGLSTG